MLFMRGRAKVRQTAIGKSRCTSRNRTTETVFLSRKKGKDKLSREKKVDDQMREMMQVI